MKARLLTILEAELERHRQLGVEVAGDPWAALPVSMWSPYPVSLTYPEYFKHISVIT